jgi:hypothetical protein
MITRPKPSSDVRDLKITGIPLENARLAIRMVGARPRKILSEAQRAALATGLRFTTRDDKSPHSGETSLGGAEPEEFAIPPERRANFAKSRLGILSAK